MEHESNGDTNCCWGAQYSHRRIGTRTGGFGNKKTSGDYSNYNIAEIRQNTKKIPRDLNRLVVTQTSVENDWFSTEFSST